MSRSIRLLAMVLAAVAINASPAAADLASAPSPTWIPDGSVNAIAVSGSTAYIGGQFDRIAPPTRGLAVVDPSTGKPRAGWPDVSGFVSAIIPDGAGGWYIGGAFTAVGGVARQNLARVRADGSVDPAWYPTVRGEVRALVRRGNTVFAGGKFDQANSVTRGNLAAFDATNGNLHAFNGSVAGSAVMVKTLAVGGQADNPILYVGGAFSSANGTARRSLASFLINSSTLSTFDPNLNNEVASIAVDGARVFAAGDFTTVNGGSVQRRYIAAFESGVGGATGWNPDVNGPVRSIQRVGSLLYAAGKFSVVNDRIPVEPAKARHSLAAFDVDTGKANGWAPQLGGIFFEGALTLTVAAQNVYVGGLFTHVNGGYPNGTPRMNVASFDAVSGAVTGFDPNPDANGIVTAIASDGKKVAIGGTFKVMGGVARGNLAAINLETGRPTDFDPRVDSAVSALAVSGARLWVGGWFSRVGASTTRQRLAAFNTATGELTPFSQGIDGPIEALAVSGSTVYAAGRFTSINGVSTRRRVVAFRDIPGTTGGLTLFDADVDGPVSALALSGDKLYLGGLFSTVGGAAHRNIAAVNADDGAVTSFNGDAAGQVRALATDGTTVYAGGDFMHASRAQRARLAAFDSLTGDLRPWRPGADGPVRTLAFAGSRLIAGGDFSTIGGASRSYLAALNPATGAVAAWAPKLTTDFLQPIRSVVETTQGGLVAGGDFTVPFGPVRAENFALFAPTAAATTAATAVPTGSADRTPPALTNLAASARRRLTIDVSEPTVVQFTARRGHRTVRFARSVPTGRWSLGVAPRELEPGRYRLRAVPTDVSGNVGRARTIRLRVGGR